MQGSGPERVDDLCFHTYEEFSPPSSNWASILDRALRLEFGPRDWDLRGGDVEGEEGEGEGENPPYV